MDDTIDGRQAIRKDKKAQELLKQFLNTDGPKGNSTAYDRGYEFSFRFTQAQRDIVNWAMEQGATFNEAFDAYMYIRREFQETLRDKSLELAMYNHIPRLK